MITQILAKNSQNKFLAHHITALGLGVAKGEFTRLSGGEKKICLFICFLNISHDFVFNRNAHLI